MDSEDFELIARLDQLDHRPSMESMYSGCGCTTAWCMHKVMSFNRVLICILHVL